MEVRSGRASPASCPTRQSQAPAHYITPSTPRTEPHSPFPFLCSTVAVALARSSSRSAERLPWPFPAPAELRLAIHHRNHSTVPFMIHRVHPCSLTALVKPLHRTRARRSSATEAVVVATPFPSTILGVFLCARFSMVGRCSYKHLIGPPWSPPA